MSGHFDSPDVQLIGWWRGRREGQDVPGKRVQVVGVVQVQVCHARESRVVQLELELKIKLLLARSPKETTYHFLIKLMGAGDSVGVFQSVLEP